VYHGKDVLKYELPSAVRRLHVYTEGGGSRILKVGAAGYSEPSVIICQAAWCDIPEDRSLEDSTN